jgi:hypothetical protein
MFRRRITAMVSALVCLLVVSSVQAQEFRVYTLMYDDRPATSGTTEKSEPLGRSVSLFHAGKAYDYIPSLTEFTLFDPVQKRFLVVNRSRMLATQVSFEEINTQLHRARGEAENYLSRIPTGDDADLKKRMTATKFQIDPKFQQTFDPQRLRLRLQGEPLNYEVLCAQSEIPKSAETFLNYADWTARLNYLLHPQTLYPGPRLALNEVLRDKQLLPREVRLNSRIGSGAQLRAVHQFHWKLEKQDRRQITECETLLRDPGLRQVTLEEYQQRLTSDSRRVFRR